MAKLERATPDRSDPDRLPVVALVHNEANILPAFLAHYRALAPASFLIVDDRSTDGSFERLAAEPDVTVFRPVAGSTYAADKAIWRSELLDAHAAGRWALVPDIDEHFVAPGGRALPGYIAALEREGAEAVATLMVDMYADRPLAEHGYDPAAGVALAQAFPFFDGPAPAPRGYTMRRVTRRTARAFPTPPVAFSGGARERLFFAPPPPAPLRRWATERFARLDRPLDPAREGALARVLGPLLAGRAGGGGLNATKLGLIRWRAGLRFNGGAHKVDAALPLSESIAVFLHYAFTRGRAGMEYIASRGQHAARGGYYRRMLAAEEALARSPLCPASRRYDGPASLAGLARDIPQAARG